MIFSIYNPSTGEILRVIEGLPEIAELNCGDGEAIYEGRTLDDQQYIEDGVVKDIPVQPHELAQWDWAAKVWIEPSEQEIYDHTAEKVRNLRNELLLESDWSQLPDVPDTIKTKYATYRDELRAISEQSGFPFEITFPERPE